MFIVIMAGTLLLGGAAEQQRELTAADIPPNLPPEVTHLIEQTFSSDAKKRALAVTKLGAMHENASPIMPFLIRLLDDETGFYEPHVSFKARDAIVALGNEAVEPLIAAGKTLPKGERYEEVITCLGRLKNKSPKALEVIVPLLRNKDSYFRYQAAKALYDCTDKQAISLLIKALDDSDARVQKAAAECFLSIRDQRAVEPLLKALDRKEFLDTKHQELVVRALGYQRDQRAVAALAKVLRNRKEDERERDELVRYYAAISLGMIGGQSAFNAVSEVFWDERESTIVRSGAVQGIALFKENDNVLTMLQNLLFSDSPSVTYELKEIIVSAMGNHGDPRAVSSLTRVVREDRKYGLAFNAAWSAVELTDGAIDDLDMVKVIREYKCLDDRIEGLVEIKREALGKIAKNGKTFRVRLAAKGAAYEYLPLVISIGCIVGILYLAYWYIKWHRPVQKRCQEKRSINEA